MMAKVIGQFAIQRGLALPLVQAGMGLASVTMTPLAARLAEAYDWRSAFAIFGRGRGPDHVALGAPYAQPASQGTADEAPTKGTSVRQAVVSWPFLVLVLTNVLNCANHSGPIFHRVSDAQICGI
jgi:predicted MFS family arabinose efflux permease